MTAHSHPAPTPGATSIATKQFRKAQVVLAATVADNDIAAVYGPPGSGKSHAVDHFVQHDPAMAGRTCHWLQMSHRPAPKELLHRLLLDLGGTPGRHVHYELTELIVDQLRGSGRVVVIDEAHHLTAAGLQQLRYLHDRCAQTWALILVGSDINRALGSAGELRSRVSGKAQFTPLTGADMLATVRQLHPALNAVDHDTLRSIDQQFPRGNMRDWVHFTRHATRLGGGGPLSGPVIRAALAICMEPSQ